MKGSFSRLDPELTSYTGGIGLISRGSKFVKLQPKTKAVQQAYRNDRQAMYGVPLPNGTLLIICNFYCWTNAHFDAQARSRTNNMLGNMLEELTHYPGSPYLLVGNMNSEADELYPLQEFINRGKLVDVGAQSAVFNATPHLPTCFPTQGDPSRRDFVFSSVDLWPLFRSFDVSPCSVPVHQLLSFQLSFPAQSPQKTVYSTPPPFASFSDPCIKQRLHVDPKEALTSEQFGEGKRIAQQTIHDSLKKHEYKQHSRRGDTTAMWSFFFPGSS